MAHSQPKINQYQEYLAEGGELTFAQWEQIVKEDAEKQIEVNIFTRDPEIEFYRSLVRALNATKTLVVEDAQAQLDIATELGVMKDAFEEFKLQNNSVIL